MFPEIKMVSVKHWARRGAVGLRSGYRNARSSFSGHLAAYLGSKTHSTLGSGRSYTRTMTKKEDPDDSGEVHSGISGANIRLSLGHPYSKKVLGSATVRLHEITQFFATSSLGKQRVEDLMFANTVSQALVGNLEGAAGTLNQLDGSVGLIDMNPNQSTTGSAYFVPAVVPTTDKIYLSNVAITVDVSNLSSGSAVLDLYFLTPNQHTNLKPTEAWSAELIGMRNGKNVYSEPAANSISTAPGYEVPQFPGAKPLQDFRKHWKILKVHNVLMGPATTEQINVNVNTNYMIDRAKITMLQNFADPNSAVTTGNITNNFLRYGTIAVMAVWRGQPVVADGSADYASYAPIQLAFVMTKKYTLKMVAGNASRLEATIGNAQLPVIGTAKVVNAADASATVVVAV